MLEKSTLCHGLRPRHSRQYEHVCCCLLSAYFRMKSVSDALSNTQKMTPLHVFTEFFNSKLEVSNSKLERFDSKLEFFNSKLEVSN